MGHVAPLRHRDAPLTLEVATDLAAVEEAWRQLETEGIATPYQRFDWIRAYAATLSADEGAQTCVVLVHGGAGGPLLLLPLAIHRRSHLRVAAPIGGKQANYHAPVMARGAAAALPPAVMQGLLRTAAARLGVDLFAFQNLPQTWAGEQNPLVLPGAAPSPSHVPWTVLPTDAEAMLQQTGTSESRRKLRRKETGLAALGEITHLQARTPTEVDQILDAFFDQKNGRFRDLGIVSPFDGEASRSFVRAACLDGLAEGRGAVELHALAVDGRIVATYGGAVDAHRFSCMFNSFDAAPEIARFSPGEILLIRLVRSQCDLGRRVLDLGIGEARYKRLVCKETDVLVDVFLPVTVKGRLHAAALKGLVAAKRHVKQTPWMWSLVVRVRAARAWLSRASKPPETNPES